MDVGKEKHVVLFVQSCMQMIFIKSLGMEDTPLICLGMEPWPRKTYCFYIQWILKDPKFTFFAFRLSLVI